MHNREEEKRRGSGGGAHVQIELASCLVLKKPIKLWQFWERGSARTAWEDGIVGQPNYILILAIQ